MARRDRDGERGERSERRREGDGDRVRRLVESVRNRRREGEREGAEGRRDREREQNERARRNRQWKWAKIFKAYDKDKDGKVTFDEYMSMKEGDINDAARRAREREIFTRADTNQDGTWHDDEFHAWMLNRGRRREGARREGREE